MQGIKGKQELAFFTMSESKARKETAAPGWTIKHDKDPSQASMFLEFVQIANTFLNMQATKGKQKLAFFTMPEYEAWKETAAPGWTIKYYKGLGTSDKKEAQEYFADIDLHRKTFVHEGVHSFSFLRCSESDFSLGRPLNQRPEPSNTTRGWKHLRKEGGAGILC